MLSQSISCASLIRCLGRGLGSGEQLPAVSSQKNLELLASLPFQGPLQGLVEGGFGFFVVLGRDFALLLFYFQLEQFFFQRFEEH